MEGSLSGEAKLCDMSVFGDKGPEYYPLTGAVDSSNHIKFDIKLDPSSIISKARSTLSG